jgi:hypothetical protein
MNFVFSSILFAFIPVRVPWSITYQHDYEIGSAKDDLSVFLFDSFAFIPVYSMSPDPWGISMTMKLEVQKMSFVFLSSIIFPFMIVNVSHGPWGIRTLE